MVLRDFNFDGLCYKNKQTSTHTLTGFQYLSLINKRLNSKRCHTAGQ